MTGYLPMDRENAARCWLVGVDLDQLFAMIPDCDCVRVAAYEALQNVGMSEQEVAEEVKALAAKNSSSQSHDSYLGAGYYDHYQPAAVQHLISRSEFLTSYTPYQAEISQGTLQAIFEWQSYITRLTGLPVANASLYDAASGAAEAALLACRDKRLYKVFVSEGVHPDTLETIRTYCHAAGIEVVTGPLDENGRTSEFPQDKKEYAGFLVQSPNFYGVVEDLDLLAEKAHEAGALAVVSQDPVSLAILKRPGDSGVDIAVGEDQSLGLPTSYGGPGAGYMAVTDRLMRKMPGRICGATVDRHGRTSYVLTLQARNNTSAGSGHFQYLHQPGPDGDCRTIWLALQGGSGLLDVAEQSAAKAIYLERKLTQGGCFKRVFSAPYFREFLLEVKEGIDLDQVNADLLEEGIIGGLVLPGNRLLIAVTEKKTKAQLDRFAKTLLRLCAEQEGGRHA